jgi:regulator of CtrA degradation
MRLLGGNPADSESSGMAEPATINPRIIDGLYCEALVLSDEVRGAFDLSGRIDLHAVQDNRAEDDAERLAFSCEALRTTTRMMHALAWLLNHRAYIAGELSEFQLKRHGRLSPDRPSADPQQLGMLDVETRALVEATMRFYARLVRLDRDWRERDPYTQGAVARLRERIGSSISHY